LAKRIVLSIIISITLFGCNFTEQLVAPDPTDTPTKISALVLTQLAMPVVTPTIDSISREAPDFRPSSTPLPSPTPTNIFLSVPNIEGYDDLVIQMERTLCFGSCPAYLLTIYGNGKGVYEGKFSVKVEGVQNFTLTKDQLGKLVQAFETAYYFSFEDYYSVGVTDMPSVTTSITFQGHSKTVNHYAWCLDYEKVTIPEDEISHAAPQALCDLEDKIDEIVNIKQWTGE
jgi:hypothetical protein